MLKGVLKEDLFEHFMAFSTAMCILMSLQLAVTHSSYAHDLLTYFIEQEGILYGQRFIVYNVHSLLHLAAEVNSFGCLDNLSAFPFENKLQQIKGMVRSGKTPLMQVANRLEVTINVKIKIERQRSAFKGRNKVFMLSGEECCEVVSVSGENKRNGLCRAYTNLQPYMMAPCDLSVPRLELGQEELG